MFHFVPTNHCLHSPYIIVAIAIGECSLIEPHFEVRPRYSN